MMFNDKRIKYLEGRVLQLEGNVSELQKEMKEFKKSCRSEVDFQFDRVNDKIEDVTAKIAPMVSGYHTICEKIINFNRDLFIKDFFQTSTGGLQKQFDEFKSKTLQPLLEAKWENERNANGYKIVNKGAEVIKERDRLHNDILANERIGIDMSKEREQLKAWDCILEMIK